MPSVFDVVLDYRVLVRMCTLHSMSNIASVSLIMHYYLCHIALGSLGVTIESILCSMWFFKSTTF